MTLADLVARLTPAQREALRVEAIAERLRRLSAADRARVEAAEEAKAAAARTSLAAWCEYGPPTERGRVVLDDWQRDLCTRVQAAVDEALSDAERNVWIFLIDAPPQSGKSEVMRRLSVWLLARGVSVGFVSYGASLAEEHGRGIRLMTRSPEAHRVWPHLRDADRKRLKDTDAEFSVPAASGDRVGPRLMPRGRDGALTGRSMRVVVTDDMFKDAADYNSAASRRQVDQFLRTSVVARLMEHGGIVMKIGTRWGVADDTGWWEERAEELRAAGLQVRVVRWSYPLRARADDLMGRAPGAYLTPRWTEDKERAARIMYGRHAPAILDGDPTPDGGAIWKREHFGARYAWPCDVMSRLCEFRGLFVDGAATSGAGDHTSVRHWGWIGPKAHFLGAWRGQWAFPELLATLRGAVAEVKPNVVVIEDSTAGRQAGQVLQREIPGVVLWPVKGAKKVRWDAALPNYGSGSVLFPEPGHWPELQPFIERMVVLTGEGDEVDDEADADAMAHLWRAEGRTVSAADRRAVMARLGR